MQTTNTGRPTIHDIARETGLSIATVSRALHQENSPNVSQQTRARILNVARELGYQTNLMGRSLVTGRSRTVSYWTQHIFAPYYTIITEQVCQQATRRKYHVMINGLEDPGRTFEGIGAGYGNPLAAHYDGIIACDVSYTINENAQALRKLNRPLIGIGLNCPPEHDRVILDLRAAGEIATAHLMERGCRRIAFMHAGPFGDPRFASYRQLMEEAGLEQEIIPCSRDQRLEALQGIQHYVTEQQAMGRQLPEAIFCKNDDVAIGCYRGLCELGIHVPDDMLLIGCDGLPETAYHACSISTIGMPIAQMCEMAWDYLEERLRDPQAPIKETRLPPYLVERESTRG